MLSHDDAQEAISGMSDAQIRRVPVLNEAGCCVGTVSQADIARKLNNEVGEGVEQVSQPTPPRRTRPRPAATALDSQ